MALSSLGVLANMNEAMASNIRWKQTSAAVPRVTVSGFAVDTTGRFPILFRGPNVRSARNVWSLPSGLHEIGLTMREQFSTELKEECGLTVVGDCCVNCGVYENIAPDPVEEEQWHWVISIMAVPVKTLDCFVNKEPEKHPEFRIITLAEIDDYLFAPGLGAAIKSNMRRIEAAIETAKIAARMAV